MKLTYDSGAFADNLDYALKLIDGADFAARRRGSEQAGKLRGLGISYYVEACGAGPGESATIKVADDGDVTVLIGTQSNGQGHETAYAQIVAARLGIDMDRIRVLQGDTDLIALGNGTGGSHTIPEGGVACDRTAEAGVAKGTRVAAQVLEVELGGEAGGERGGQCGVNSG